MICMMRNAASGSERLVLLAHHPSAQISKRADVYYLAWPVRRPIFASRFISRARKQFI